MDVEEILPALVLLEQGIERLELIDLFHLNSSKKEFFKQNRE